MGGLGARCYVRAMLARLAATALLTAALAVPAAALAAPPRADRLGSEELKPRVGRYGDERDYLTSFRVRRDSDGGLFVVDAHVNGIDFPRARVQESGQFGVCTFVEDEAAQDDEGRKESRNGVSACLTGAFVSRTEAGGSVDAARHRGRRTVDLPQHFWDVERLPSADDDGPGDRRA
jgi:hypothetical protein